MIITLFATHLVQFLNLHNYPVSLINSLVVKEQHFSIILKFSTSGPNVCIDGGQFFNSFSVNSDFFCLSYRNFFFALHRNSFKTLNIWIIPETVSGLCAVNFLIPF